MASKPTFRTRIREDWTAQPREDRGDATERGALLAAELEERLEELQVAHEAIAAQAAELEAALREAEHHRQRYHEMFFSAPDGYLLTDQDGLIYEANRAATTLLERPPTDLIGKALPSFIPDLSTFRGKLAKLARLEHVGEFEIDVALPDRTTIPLAITASAAPARESDVEIRWLLRDRRAQRAAREQERRLRYEQAARVALEQVVRRARFLADASARLGRIHRPDRIWGVAADLAAEFSMAAAVVTIDDNRVTVRAVGGLEPARQALDPRIGTHVEADDALIPAAAIQTVVRTRRPDVLPAGPTPSGEAGLTLVVPLVMRERVVAALVLWFRAGETRVGEEILVAEQLGDRIVLALENTLMFAELERARRQAEEARHAESEFLLAASHELRSPLTAMVIYGELLEDVADDLPANPRAWIKRVAHATRHQHRLVEQILTYKRMQVDDAVRAEPLDFRDIVGPAVDMARAATRDRPVAIDVDIPDVPLDGTCDRGMLVQIATNLLSNAVRFTPEGRVRFAVRADGDLVCLTVQDEGIGIRADDLPHIFERFWRGHQREDGGSCGLGLTITRELVDRLAGRVEVESKPGHGSTFRVWIPRTSPGSPIPARS